MDEWKNGWKNGWMNGRMDEWMDEWMNGWMGWKSKEMTTSIQKMTTYLIFKVM